MTDSTAPKQRGPGKPFQPGASGNPAGRPKGAKDKLRCDFIKALTDDFAAHGVEAVTIVRQEQPAQYLKVIAAVLPKEIELRTNALEEMSDDELIAGIAALQRLVAQAEAGAGTNEASGEGVSTGLH